MTKLVNHSRRDDAVSPVVGVMLMIVVTVVIAAVVALFATSVTTSSEPAPVAVIDMNASAGTPAEINNKLVMSTRGGDPLDLTKLKVTVTINDGDDGTVYKGLDKNPVVGQFLEIGEYLVIFGEGTYCVPDTASQIGKGFDPITDMVVGEKIKVSVIFNDNAILYERELIVKDGNTSVVVEEFNVEYRDGLFASGDVIRISAGNSLLLEHTSSGSSGAKGMVNAGKINVPVGTKITVTIKEETARVGTSYELSTLSTISTPKSFAGNTDPSKDYQYVIDYSLVAEDIGTSTGIVSIKNPIFIESSQIIK